MWKKRLAIASLLMTVLLFILIQSASFQQWLLRRLQNLASAAQFPFKADKLRLNIFELQASLDGFVYDKDGTKVRVDHVLVDIPWNGFLGHAIVVNSLIADGVTINVQSPEVVLPSPSGQKQEMPKFQIGRLSIRNVNLTYTNQNMLVKIPSFNIEATNGRGNVQIASPITISPDTQIALQQIPIALGTDSAQFGPMKWSAQYTDYSGDGTADGDLKWSPSVAFHLNFSTEPMTIEKWKDLQASGKAGYDDGKFKLSDVRIVQGTGSHAGQLIASAEISDQNKTAMVIWNALQLDPAGVPGSSDGTLNLQWKASDLSDASGQASVNVASRQYGNAHGDIHIDKGNLSGTFDATQNKYGLVRLNGKVGGTLDNPTADAAASLKNATFNGLGPINASANALLRGKVVSIRDLRANLKNTTIPNGSLRVNLENKTLSGEIPDINVDVNDFAADARGKATLSAKIEGTTDRPVAQLTGSSDGIDIGGTHIDSAGVSGRFANNTLVLNRLEARQANGNLEALGSLNLTTKRIDGDAHITNFQLVQVRDLSTTVNLDATIGGTTISPATDFKGELQKVIYKGKEQGNITVEGRTVEKVANIRAISDKYKASADAEIQMQRPFPFTTTLTADQSHIQYEQYDVVANGKASASGQLQPFEARGLNFDQLTVKGNGMDLTANGAMDTGATIHLTADLAQLPVENVTMTGSAKVDATISGNITNPIVDGTLTTSNATVQTSQMTEAAALEGSVDFNSNDFSIAKMQATIADAVVDVTGHGTLKGTGEFQFEAKNVHPENFLKDRPISGTLGLKGSVKLASPALEGISGDAQITQMDLNLRDIPIHEVHPIDISIENQTLMIRSFEVEGADTHATITGSADLQSRTLDLNIDGNTDLGILEAFIPGSAAQGKIQTRLAVRGTADHPNLDGFINVTDTQLQIINPPMMLTKMDAEVRFSGDRLEITRASGNLNDGEFKASGGAGISAQGLKNASIALTLTKAQLEYPEGLQSELTSNITLSGDSPDLVIGGVVDIDNALYRRDVDLTEEVFDRITAEHNEANTAHPRRKLPAFAEQIRMDVQVRNQGPVSISNNMANLDMYGAFQVIGNLANPIILGRADVLEGGELYFGPAVATQSSVPGERRDRYVIDRGIIEFNNTLLTEPTFDFEATHEMQVKDERYLVTLRADGTPTRLRTEFTSDPSLDEQDIKWMLLTGRTFAELQGSMLAVGEEQLANYFSGRVSGFFEEAGSALGLDTVRIEPVALAETSDLGARLTLGKDITRHFNLAYSQSLAGARSQSWIANYSTFKKLLLRGINDTENKEITFEVKQDLRFGGGPPLPKRVAPGNETVLGNVAFTGTGINTKALQKQITKEGHPFNAYRMNQDVRKLKQFLAKDNLLRAKVHAHRDPRDGRIDVTYTIEEGPKITFDYRGTNVPSKVQDDIRQIWLTSLTDGTSLQDSNKRLLRYLRDDGYLQAKVTAENEVTSEAERHYVFNIEPGQKFKAPEWIFKGIDPVEVPKKAGTVMEKPETIQEQIEFTFQKDGYLDATATVPELIYQEEGPRFVVTVDKGKQYMVGRIDFTGNSFMQDRRLRAAVRQGPTNPAPVEEAGRPPETQEELPLFPFTSDWIQKAQQRATTEYWQEGFNGVQITPATETDKAKGQVYVHFAVDEGERQMIDAVQVDGAELTDMSYVMRQFQFKEGDPVDYTRVSLTRKKLYDTTLFKRVEIEMVKSSTSNGYIAQVHLNENAPWRFRYGFAVGKATEQTGRDLGVTTDLSYANLFGKGILTGVAFKDTRGLKDARIYGTFPTFFGREIHSTGTVFRTRDFRTLGTVEDLKGFTAQQQRRLRNYYILSYDYSFRWDHIFDRDLNDTNLVQNVTLRIARLDGTLTRDTRDDLLNATRGTFFSNSLEVAPPLLGSNIHFVRNYTQYFRFKQVNKNLVWANAIRGGVARSFGGASLVPSEQFLAGGGTTLRAFKQDQLTLSPGNALFILNTELRFPVWGRLGAVTFFDAGNVYQTIGNVNVFSLRYSPGLGLRIKSPLGLLRFDMGLNLWARTGEDRRRYAFGIGQAF